MDILEFENLNIEIKRKSGYRKMSLKIFPNLKVRVTTNNTCSVRDIVTFLELQKDWLRKKTTQFESLRTNHRPKTFQEGEVFPFLGKNYFLKIESNKEEIFKLEGEYFIWSLSEELKKKYQEQPDLFLTKLRDAYKTVSGNILRQRFVKCAQKMQLTPKTMILKDLKSMWGSCLSRESKITLNWKLIVFDVGVIDYVIIHELCHLVHNNHSARFWSLVKIHDPQCADHRKVLRQEPFKTDFLTRKSQLWI